MKHCACLLLLALCQSLAAKTLYVFYAAPAAGEFRPRAASPCVNAGTNLAWMAAAVDLDGRPRLDQIHAQVDMGCYEYHYQGTAVLLR